MFKRAGWLVAVTAGALFLTGILTPAAEAAPYRGRAFWGGGYYHGYRPYWNHGNWGRWGYGYRPYWYGGYRNGWYGGYGNWGYGGYGNWGLPYVYNGIYPYWYSSYYPYYVPSTVGQYIPSVQTPLVVNPIVTTTPSATTEVPTTATTPPVGTEAPVPATTNASAAAEKPCRVRVLMPIAAAQLRVDGEFIAGTGVEREFVTPPLQPGKSYHYHMEVSWTENGQTFKKDRDVNVEAGGNEVVNFMNATPSNP